MIKKKGVQLVTDILGTKIKTRDGEEVGVVQNVMIDPDDGTIVYIMLCFANFIGKTNRHFAIPHHCMNINESQDGTYFLEIDIEKLVIASEVASSDYANTLQNGIYELLQDATQFTPKYLN